MDKPSNNPDSQLAQPKEETMLQRAVRNQLKRREMLQGVCSTPVKAPVPTHVALDTVH